MTPEAYQQMKLEREIEERNRPLTDEELDALLPGGLLLLLFFLRGIRIGGLAYIYPRRGWTRCCRVRFFPGFLLLSFFLLLSWGRIRVGCLACIYSRRSRARRCRVGMFVCVHACGLCARVCARVFRDRNWIPWWHPVRSRARCRGVGFFAGGDPFLGSTRIRCLPLHPDAWR